MEKQRFRTNPPTTGVGEPPQGLRSFHKTTLKTCGKPPFLPYYNISKKSPLKILKNGVIYGILTSNKKAFSPKE
jgi:hypothetical protein